MVIFLMLLKMLRKLVDTGAQQRYLDLRRSGIALMLLVFLYYLCFLLNNERQVFAPPKAAPISL